MPTSDPTAAPPACLNCGRQFIGARPRFCPDCGQESNVKPPTLGEFAQQFGGSYIAAEGALWRTLGLLLFRPGQLTCEYLAGRRRRYVLPLRLYLTISLFVLLLVRLTSTIQMDATSEALAARDKPVSRVTIGASDKHQAGLVDGKFYCVGLPQWVCQRLKRRLDADPKSIARELHEAPQRFLSHWSAAMFLLVPAFALWLKLVYRNRGLRYTEHLVFALHLHAFWFIAVGVFMIDAPAVSAAAAVAMPGYALLAARRVYGGRWWPTVLRTIAVTTLYGLTLALALGIVVLWTLLD